MADLEDAVLKFVQSGELELSEDIATTRLDTTSTATIRRKIDQARKQHKAEVAKLSRSSSQDVDSWIEQAERLQQDIEHSKALAREVVEQAEEAARAKEARDDQQQKIALLRNESTFNQRLQEALKQIQDVASGIATGQDLVAAGNIEAAISAQKESQHGLTNLRGMASVLPVNLLLQRSQTLEHSIKTKLSEHWKFLLKIDHSKGSLKVKTGNPDLTKTTDMLQDLNLLDSSLMELKNEILVTILEPRLDLEDGSSMDFESDSITMKPRRDTDIGSLVSDLQKFITFLDKLPRPITRALSESLMPETVRSIISEWLAASIPTGLATLDEFEKLQKLVTKLADHLADTGWLGGAELTEWVEQGAKLWVSKRREMSLLAVRDALKGVETTKKVERIETMNADEDVWGARENAPKDQSARQNGDTHVEASEDLAHSDTSAWDDADADADSSAWDEPQSENDASAWEDPTPKETADDEAWGWEEPQSPGNNRTEKPTSLKETYTVTVVPDSIMDTVKKLSQDGIDLQDQKYSVYPVASAATALFTIPPLVLAGFRALAPTFYSPLVGGNMYLYNDTVRLENELKLWASEIEKTNPDAFKRLRVATDIDSLTSFGKRAYGKEMESQRTILRDLLDTTQGFASCTHEPFASSCDTGISMTIDRLRQVGKEWKPILSENAWLQSMGSLLNAIVNKVTDDICDLSDISEPESKKLKGYCDQVSKLSDLFAAEQGQGDRTAIFVSSWIRFQYLAEILDSTLADIKYLWQETELRRDFAADDVVDLIEALFADSDHRRKAIAEIRRR